MDNLILHVFFKGSSSSLPIFLTQSSDIKNHNNKKMYKIWKITTTFFMEKFMKNQ